MVFLERQTLNNIPTGMLTPMSKEEYKQELKLQAEEARQRKERAKVDEALMEKRQVEAAEIQHNLHKYNSHVGDGNDKLALKQEMVRCKALSYSSVPSDCRKNGMIIIEVLP